MSNFQYSIFNFAKNNFPGLRCCLKIAVWTDLTFSSINLNSNLLFPSPLSITLVCLMTIF